MREDIETLLFSVIARAFEDATIDEDVQIVNTATVLFGEGAKIDSLTLVNIIVDLEDEISDRFGKAISLTDDDAVFREPSPYGTVATLRDYIIELLSRD